MGKMVKCTCPQCGAISLADVKETTEDGWLPCVLPGGFEWNLPSGKITPVVGSPIYTDAEGKQYSREEYMAKFNIDPEIAYTKMRETIGGVQAATPIGAGAGTKPKKAPVQLGKGGKK